MAAPDLGRIARSRGIRLLLQFGSTVSGQVHERSDVDLAVLLERPALTLRHRAELLHDLQGLFPGREVDLAILNHADPLLLRQVMQNFRQLHGSPADLRSLQLLAFKRYQDHRRYLDLERRFVAEAVAALILDDLRAVTPIAQKALDAYLADPINEVLVERYLERMIGRMIDINYHRITDAGHAPPRDSYDSFTQLAKLRILPPAFASQIATCAGLRNRLVHEYDEIDPRRVQEGLLAAVRDIPEYLRHVHEHVERAP